MKVFSYKADDGQLRIGIEVDGNRYNFSQLWNFFKEIKAGGKGTDLYFLQLMVELGYFELETFTTVLDTVKDYRPIKDLLLVGPVNFQEPISRPQKIIAMARNYLKHAKELKNEAPGEPIFFLKPPSSQIGHGKPIMIPTGIGQVDHEIELAIVINKPGRFIGEKFALDYVAGYTIAVDVTAREMQITDKKQGLPWTRSKGYDTFCPIGPYLIPKELIPNPHNLKIELSVNDEIRQSANTGEMIFNIETIISHVSRNMSLQSGDIILTGTPEGVGPLRPGDKIEATIAGLGTLRNRVSEL